MNEEPEKKSTPVGNMAKELAESGVSLSAAAESEREASLKRLRTYRDDVAEALRAQDSSVISINLAEHERDMTRAKAEEIRLHAQEDYRLAKEDLEKAQGEKKPFTIQKIKEAFTPKEEGTRVELEAAKERFRESKAVLEAREAAALPSPVLTPKKPSAARGPLVLIATLLFIGGGAIGGGIWFYKMQSVSPIRGGQLSPIVFADTTETLDIAGLEGGVLKDSLQKTAAHLGNSSGNIHYVYMTEGTPDKKQPATGSQFISALKTTLPAPFIRSTGDKFMFGYHRRDGGDSEPFIILTTTYYGNAFAGMFEWEKNMQKDLSPLFGEAEEGSFRDGLVKNQNVRIFENSIGAPLLLYTFLPDKETIVIAGSEATLIELTDRLSAGRVVR